MVKTDLISILFIETVPVAIPLILFAVDFGKWLHTAKSTVIDSALVSGGY